MQTISKLRQLIIIGVLALGLAQAVSAQPEPERSMGPGRWGEIDRGGPGARKMWRTERASQPEESAQSKKSKEKEPADAAAERITSKVQGMAVQFPAQHPMEHTVAASSFYRERTFWLLVGLFLAGAGYIALRVVRRRWRVTSGPVEFVNEAVLVVDLADSTHLSTHYGNGLAMQARNYVKEQTLAAARVNGLKFAESTGDGYFMTFPSVGGALQTASELLRDLENRPPQLASGMSLAVRAGISYGEILLDSGDVRHGAVINKAFRLEGVSRANFSQVAGEGELKEIPDRNRILLDEEAAKELQADEIPLRFLGFCSLKGFPGLHRVYEVRRPGRA